MVQVMDGQVMTTTRSIKYDVGVLAAVGNEVPSTIMSTMAEQLETDLQKYCQRLHKDGAKTISINTTLVASITVVELK